MHISSKYFISVLVQRKELRFLAWFWNWRKLIEIKGDQFLKEDGTWQNPFDHTEDDKYEAKHQCAISNGIEIMYFNQYVEYIEYIKQKYGNDYLKQFRVKGDESEWTLCYAKDVASFSSRLM